MRFTFKFLSFLLLAIPALANDLQKSDLLGWYEIIDQKNLHQIVQIEENDITVQKYPSYMSINGTWSFADSNLTAQFRGSLFDEPQSRFEIIISLKDLSLKDLQNGAKVDSTSREGGKLRDTEKISIRKIACPIYRFMNFGKSIEIPDEE